MDIDNWMKKLPVLKSEKNPTLALILGFLLGGLGLAIYFRKVIDFFIPIFVVIVLEVLHSQLQGQGTLYILVGAVITRTYGYLRAKSSNEALAEQHQALASNGSTGA